MQACTIYKCRDMVVTEVCDVDLIFMCGTLLCHHSRDSIQTLKLPGCCIELPQGNVVVGTEVCDFDIVFKITMVKLCSCDISTTV